MLRKFKQDYPKFKLLFPFQEFNEVQKECFPKIFNYEQNMIVSAPTSSGKTVLFQLLIVKLFNQYKTKCLYLAPIKSLCHQKYKSWRKKFMTTMNIMELTGDTLQMQPGEFGNADIYVATPEKIDYISRKNLNFLKQLNLLLIDQIHMLNMQDRGAILQAIVSRIMSINKNIRIMAVSATIPNISQVAQWLKVPPNLICVFGNQYRPAKLSKIVLGFKPANNDFNFEKMLNFKILDVIRHYSYGGGTLIFCQTQKGTEEACSKLVSQANPRQFIQTQQLANNLKSLARNVDNSTLQSFLAHGVAFHNASLSMKDRSIVEDLFLDFKIKVLCTTSTLAMGINLPARLVIIKSTKCYKGSGKGYQQYTQIQLDQMMGRAGRIPFDKQGTVVIMTQKNNYNKYVGQIKLQNLQSQLYYQFIDHLNTEISLKSIQSLNEAIGYFKNSFCYIRMQTSPKLYNLQNKNQIQKFVLNTCTNCVKKLAQYEIIQYIQTNQKIYPRQCSYNLSKNAIEVDTIIKVIEQMGQIRTQRQFINLICNANQLSKYRSKLDQRKCLKDLNQKNRYVLKQAISTYDKKCFVLIQAQLTGLHIDDWQLRKQASQMIFLLRRLAYCIKSLALQRKNGVKTFWLYLFGCLFHKYFSQGFWQTNDQKSLKQINKVEQKWKNISARGIRTLQDLIQGMNKLQVFGNSMNTASIKQSIQEELNLLSISLQVSAKKVEDSHNQNQNNIGKQPSHMLKFIFTQNFNSRFKTINIIVEHNSSIYHSGFLNSDNLEFSVFLKNTQTEKYFIAVIKQGYIGFDQFYWFQKGLLKKTQLKKQQNQKKLIKSSSLELTDKKRKSSKNFLQLSSGQSQQKRRTNSLSSSLKRATKNKPENKRPKKINYIQPESNKDKYVKSNLWQNEFFDEDSNFQSNQQQITTKINKRSKQLKLTENFSTIKRKYVFDQQQDNKQKEDNFLGKSIKRISGNHFRDLKSYNWKPGFEQIKDDSDTNQIIYQQQNKLFKKNANQQNTNSNQKQRKLMLSDDQDKQQTTTKTQQKKQDKPYNGRNNVIQQLNQFMNEKASTNNSFEKKETKINKQKNNKKNDLFSNNKLVIQNKKKKNIAQIKYIPLNTQSQKQQQDQTTDTTKSFLQKLRKNIQPNQPNTQRSNNLTYQRKPLLFNKAQQIQKNQQKNNTQLNLGDKNPLKFEFNQQTQIQQKKEKPIKSFKNPYDYFGSYLDDQEEYQ